MVIVRIGFVALLGAVLLSACGDNPLGGLGVTEDWLGDPGDGIVRTVTTEAAATRPEVGSLDWYNPPVAFVEGDPAAVVEEIWARSSGTDAFVQAAPNEISAVVPAIKVPQFLPVGTAHVTSQLVFGVSTGQLTNAYVAAFGFWKSTPYRSSRSVSQLLQLKVAEDSSDPAPSADDDSLGCNRFNDLDITACEPVSVSAAVAWWITTRDGPVLTWYDTGLRYELLDRQKFGMEVLVELARSMILLRNVEIAEQSDS
ncbi:MAG: hypothetical protein JJE47_16325 [Acidimicrobiia bacterium]|nr:hypothetical protein [Acidimicrobiia bacterium]